MDSPKVLILLAAYNGESYIEEMIRSVLDQSFQNFRLILSDDGSTDATAQLLETYAEQYPDKVLHYRSGQKFGCAQRHFMHLLNCFHDAPYIMFCDQDDVWDRDKVEKTLAFMRSTESDPCVPTLVHTDLRVVDGDAKVIAPSFCRHSAIDGRRLQLNQLLVQNVVTGCTLMINRALAELACRDVDMSAVLMHDWWLALLASACGKAAFLDTATMSYRQHGNNSVGAKKVHSLSYLFGRLAAGSMRASLEDAADQAEAFLTCYADVLSPRQKEILRAFASIHGASVIQRDRIYLKYGLLKNGMLRICAQFFGL